MIITDKYTLEELKNGYSINNNNAYQCICCGAVFEDGEVFRFGERFFNAERAIKLHMAAEHPQRLTELLDCGSRYLQLTQNQKELLACIGAGLTDNQIAEKLGVTPSTVRHQRFMFRERAKSARMYLAAWEIAVSGAEKSKAKPEEEFLPIHEEAKMIDDRYNITEKENQQILDGAFESLSPLKLKQFSPKEKKKIVILRRIAEQFEKNRHYSEKEVNQILEAIYDDYVTIRRYLIEYGYMDRTKDCKDYWLR
ncbi:DUF2087 domain-containing protein [Acetanaerobacterium elongatum]|uniref:HTH luxR-type domain-containing protein n=1 Tax=Acetanaerobacterium elongatum TaxID=258515 RepID=A0A1H0BQW5_9FIRM|nr:hypothetical protein SAMN05192585_12031 [Acetanaerobacterium elongatum]